MKLNRGTLAGVLAISTLAVTYIASQSSGSDVNTEDRSIASAPTDQTTAATNTPSSPTGDPSDEEHERAITSLEAALKSEGWKETTGTAPDEDVIALNPKLLGTERERDLQMQIHTNSFSGADLKQLYEIALQAESAKTQTLAIEALGRSTDPEASRHLIQLYGAVSEAGTKTQILTQVAPASLDDESAVFLKQVASSSEASSDDKELATATLTLVALSKGNRLPASLLSEVPSEFHAQMNELARSISQGGPALTHGHQHE